MNASLLSALHGARDGLRDWSSPLVNPFLAQSRRVDARGARWPLALVFIAALWLFAMIADVLLLDTIGPSRDFARDGARLWIGITWVVAFVMARLRDSELLRQEVLKGRFEPIQLLPMAATRRAWLWSAPNSLWGLLVVSTMLPAIAWSVGDWLEPREALLLIILVILTMWSVPLWTPGAWRMQANKTDDSDKNSLKALRSNTRRAKMSDGLVLPPDLAVDARGWGGGIGLTGPIWLMAQFGLRGIALGVAQAYWQGLPFHVRAAAAEIWFNWPLFLVRWLAEPQPFFAFSLAPIILFLPGILASATMRILRLAAVTGREPFWTPRHLALWKRAQTVQSAQGFLFLLGILWPGAIANEAWLASWFGKLAGTPAQALAAWWILAVAAGALATTAMWRAALELPVGPLTLRAQAPRAAKLAIRGMAWALAFWALCCLLGWRSPWSTLWLQVTPALLAMAAVWIGAQTSSWAAQRVPRFSLAFTIWHALWFYGGPVGGALLLILAQFPVALLSNFYPLSPWTLWLMLRQPNVAANSIFWIACGAHLGLAIIVGALAWLLGRDRIAVVSAAVAPDNETILDELTPQSPPENAPVLPPMAQAINLARKPLAAPDAWTTKLLNGLARFNNPLLNLETRRALTADTRQFAWWMLGLQALVVSVPTIVLPAFYRLTGYWASDTFMIFAGLLLAIPCAAVMVATSGAALCYDRDRLDGTLELLFLTPRTSSEIAVGKTGPFGVRAALLGLLFLPSFAVGALLSPQVAEPLLGVAYLVAPLWVCALVTRGIMGAHWMALKKRKIGPSNVSFAISLVIAFALILEIGALISSFVMGAWFVLGAAVLLSAIYVVEAILLWKRGVAALERWRWQGAPGAK